MSQSQSTTQSLANPSSHSPTSKPLSLPYTNELSLSRKHLLPGPKKSPRSRRSTKAGEQLTDDDLQILAKEFQDAIRLRRCPATALLSRMAKYRRI
ncbi:hypothetical protein NX059_008202 [Plenodomus lindquistii]|nr:hypothetical protein NX059_008202 [Plenodomus lindquistii]